MTTPDHTSREQRHPGDPMTSTNLDALQLAWNRWNDAVLRRDAACSDGSATTRTEMAAAQAWVAAARTELDDALAKLVGLSDENNDDDDTWPRPAKSKEQPKGNHKGTRLGELDGLTVEKKVSMRWTEDREVA
ncbi:MAG: hypothetical protein GY679_00730 [Mycoplasma sp.]|nr:hypothetical protein [Mycoplasma sp.]